MTQRERAIESIKEALRRIAELGDLHGIDVDELWAAHRIAREYLEDGLRCQAGDSDT